MMKNAHIRDQVPKNNQIKTKNAVQTINIKIPRPNWKHNNMVVLIWIQKRIMNNKIVIYCNMTLLLILKTCRRKPTGLLILKI